MKTSKGFFTFELSAFPLSLFNEEGMRKGTKSSLFSASTPTKIDAVQAVVFDGYPSDVNGNSAKSAERIRRANLHSSHEIIFNEATCPETSQEQFLANGRNKVRFIDLLKKFLQKANVTVKQAVKDADVLIVETAVSVKSQYDNIFVVGEGIDLLVLLTGLAPMKENLYFRKCGKGRTPVVLYSTTSFKYKFSRMILFIHAFRDCDTSTVVFDGYPSDVNGNSAKSAERIRRANLHSSHEIIFNEATCPETSQEQFLANERNKVRFIDLLKKFLQKANVTVKQAVKDADVLIVETAVSVKSQYDNIFVVGEGIDLLVLLTGLAPMKENLYFRKCGKGRTPVVLDSTTSFKYKFSRMILFIHAFRDCDTSSTLFGHGKTKFCFLEKEKKKKYPTLGKKYKYFSTLKLPLTKWLRQAKLF
ncbi:hypothetical protein AVEN_136948-1 [Araneus ventricosus]|uniref:Uncharacterized protein n=1 Tax=Araneus ventricosus TaxID=182803 RepID=A0A4Y2BJD6_ARAVE|nr:hypothetical protein AVEN_136948-1 [Araneus ventricosus]